MDCIFCKIAQGLVPAELLAENEFAIAFRDINPQSKTHILVVPRSHSSDVSKLTDAVEVIGLFDLIRVVASSFTDGQFRLQFNTGEREGQSVFHTHAHILSQSAV